MLPVYFGENEADVLVIVSLQRWGYSLKAETVLPFRSNELMAQVAQFRISAAALSTGEENSESPLKYQISALWWCWVQSP
jgi:hypothetical protein